MSCTCCFCIKILFLPFNLTFSFLFAYRCVICQMEYKRGDRRITLPCKHVYHADCGTRWLSINKVKYSTLRINDTLQTSSLF